MQIGREMKRVAYRLYRNKRRVRESIDWLVGKVKTDSSSVGISIRTIFDFDALHADGEA